MINNYALFNDHDNNNSLYIMFSDENITGKKGVNNVVALYNNDKIIGYLIEDFIRFAKIKYSGIIFLPNDILIDIINSILSNEQLETLGYKTCSGYFIKNNDSFVGVYAEKGTFLRDGTISKGKYCTYRDLYIENSKENELIEIDDRNLDGKDFFLNKEVIKK